MKALHADLVLPTRTDRPFFFSNFVQTLDGKVQVRRDPKAYWPLGSATDYASLIELRAHADVLIHGRGTAEWIRAVDNLGKPEFQERRHQLGKTRPFLYCIVSSQVPATLRQYLENPPAGVEVLLVTPGSSVLPAELRDIPHQVCGETRFSIAALSEHFHVHNYQQVLVEGGPTLLSAFLEEKYLDELFLTLAPRIIGSEADNTMTLIEGHVFTPETTPRAQLLSHQAEGDELYLRYQLNYAD